MAINRRTIQLVWIAAAAATIMLPSYGSAQTTCSSSPLAVQVLGSGGPHPVGARASTSYLVWHRGKAVVMVDAGGGSFLRFGESGARLEDLSLLAISHVHPDHVSDLPALLWLSEVARQRPLRIAGPSGAGAYPGFEAFLARLFDSRSGAFPILGGTLRQAGRGVPLEVIQVAGEVGRSSSVLSDSTIDVRALGVPHADVPSIAYRVKIANRTIVFGSDQNGSDARFTDFASGADLLVMHLSVSQRAPDDIARIHARPATVGQIARQARAKRLVLSHFIQTPASVRTPEWFSGFDLDRAVAEVRTQYAGPVDAAVDLQCIPVP